MLLIPLTIERQIEDMANFYPYFTVERPQSRNITKAKNTVEWIGKLRPTPDSIEYTIKIQYELPIDPRVDVLEPFLKLAEGKKHLPHIYREGCLCLFTPKKGEWNSGKSIAKTIVPWTSLWLYFYEIWLLTGEWFGGGTEPTQTHEN